MSALCQKQTLRNSPTINARWGLIGDLCQNDRPSRIGVITPLSCASMSLIVVSNNQDGPDGASRRYPKEWERRLQLPDGTRIFVRPVRPDDDELFRDFAKGVSEEDARQRFFAPKKELSDVDLARLVHLDYERAMAFVASEESSGRMVGVVRLHADPNRESREFAIIIRSDFKGHGLGWMLMQLIIEYARTVRLRVIEGRILWENKTMLKMCRNLASSC